MKMASNYGGTREERILAVQKAMAAFLKQKGGRASRVACIDFIKLHFFYSEKLAKDYLNLIQRKETFDFNGYDFLLKGESK